MEEENSEEIDENNHNVEQQPRKMTMQRNCSSNDLITKEASVQSMGKRLRRESTLEKPEHVQIAEDTMFFINSGVEAIIGGFQVIEAKLGAKFGIFSENSDG